MSSRPFGPEAYTTSSTGLVRANGLVGVSATVCLAGLYDPDLRLITPAFVAVYNKTNGFVTRRHLESKALTWQHYAMTRSECTMTLTSMPRAAMEHYRRTCGRLEAKCSSILRNPTMPTPA